MLALCVLPPQGKLFGLQQQSKLLSSSRYDRDLEAQSLGSEPLGQLSWELCLPVLLQLCSAL